VSGEPWEAFFEAQYALTYAPLQPDDRSRIVDFRFGHLALHRIRAACDVDNHASARVLEKLGMRREGHLRQSRRR
jgi:Acetyltransferase (GNAT) domain